MATYKVIQDIEAEDHILGPLSLRQFIYGAIAAVCGYLSFIAISKGASFLLAIFVPPMLFTGFFAFPWGRDQPTEVWALAKIRFYLKSRRRLWDQSGVKNLVTITAPKRIEKNYTNGLSETEVRSRLTALASTLDSRGWAIKNVNANLYDPARARVISPSDRLVDPNSMPMEVSAVDLTPGDDMLDPANNPRAQELDRLMAEASNARRQQIVDQLNGATAAQPLMPELPTPTDSWFLRKPVELPSVSTSLFTDIPAPLPASPMPQDGVATEPTLDEKAIAEKLKAQREKAHQAINYQHLKVIQPLGKHAARPPKPAPVPVTPVPDPVTMELAGNDDLSVATLARIAHKQDGQTDEVVISLHNHDS